MKNNSCPLDKKQWLQEGFLLQMSEDMFLLGEGPFFYSSLPCYGLYHPDFFLQNKKPWISVSRLWKTNKKNLQTFLYKKEGFNKKKLFQKTSPPSFIEFQSLFFQVQNKIQSGFIQKAVPAFCETLKNTLPLSLLLKTIFQKRISIPQDCFLYGTWTPKGGILGLTPEFLFTLEKKSFRTMALAGTFPHPGPSLTKDSKESMEQKLVIKSISRSFKRTGFLEKPNFL